METLTDFWLSCPEYQRWGLNALTFSFLATVFFTALQGWSLLKQSRKIWKNRSGTSVSVYAFTYFAGYYLVFSTYGFQVRSLAIILNGFLFFVHVPILLGLWRFEKYSCKEVFFTVIVMSAFVLLFILDEKQKDLLLFTGLMGILWALTMQIAEIIRTRKTGSVEPRFIIVFMATAVFWFIYAIVIGNWPLIVFNPLSFCALLLILLLYLKYRRPAAA